MKKKLFTLLLSGTALAAFADDDPFLTFNNNAGLVYQNTNVGDITTINQYGVAATIQTKTDFWFDAQALSGLNANSGTNLTTTGLKFGYVFPFAKNQSTAYQLIPYINLGYAQSGSTGMSGTSYIYGIGFKPEYRFGKMFMVAVDLGIQGASSSFNGGNSYLYNNNNNSFNYVIAPEIDYNLSDNVLFGVSYSYANNFAGNNSMPYGSSTNTVSGKVAWLFN